jgi:hypothetical protein
MSRRKIRRKTQRERDTERVLQATRVYLMRLWRMLRRFEAVYPDVPTREELQQAYHGDYAPARLSGYSGA